MGAIAEAFTAFAQPLIDQTDGSMEQLNKALSISQLCYNLALLPADRRSAVLADTRQSLEMDDNEFEDFCRSVIFPMIERHQEMFPFMHPWVPLEPSHGGPLLPAQPSKAGRAERYPGTDRYAPCPCNSGEKYKFCCGKKAR